MAHSYSPVNFPNDWTPVSMAAANQVPDSPLDSSGDNVGNYATWNPLMPVVSTAAYTFTQGNRDVDITGYDCICNSTLIVDVEDSDGFYAEIDVSNLGSTTTWYAGINTDPDARTQASNIVNDANTYFVRADGGKYNTSVSAGYAGTLAASDTLQVIIKSGSLYFGKAGIGWADGSGGWTTSDFASATAAFTGLTGYVSLCVANSSTSDNGFTLNAGQSAYTGTPPTGTKNWATYNLPTPTVTDPSKYFANLLYTGNGTAIGSGGNVITGAGFQPDFVWIKNRDAADSHMLFDAVRGTTKYFSSDSLNNEATDTETIDSFDADGFTVGSNVAVNTNTENYVAWCFKADNTSGSSNTDGTITATVAAGTGFSIGTYSGNATSGATVGHGLSAAPDFIIVKQLTGASTQRPIVYHSSEGETKNGFLDLANAFQTSTAAWNDTAPTTSVFSLGNDNFCNGSSRTYGFYAFAKTPGLIGVGSYVGNGSSDGPYIVVDDGGSGFRPAWLLTKNVDYATNGDWLITDAARSTYNPVELHLRADNTQAESALSGDFDFTANGFKVISTHGTMNRSGDTYIYLAFAEMPFQTQARAR